MGSNPTLSAILPDGNYVEEGRIYLLSLIKVVFIKKRRDVREAEGARLEIVWVVSSRLEGSNPSLSAR